MATATSAGTILLSGRNFTDNSVAAGCRPCATHSSRSAALELQCRWSLQCGWCWCPGREPFRARVREHPRLVPYRERTVGSGPRARRSACQVVWTRGARNPDVPERAAPGARPWPPARRPDECPGQSLGAGGADSCSQDPRGSAGSGKSIPHARGSSPTCESLRLDRARRIPPALLIRHPPDHERAALDLLADDLELRSALLLGSFACRRHAITYPSPAIGRSPANSDSRPKLLGLPSRLTMTAQALVCGR